jgi:hypothetical protein
MPRAAAQQDKRKEYKHRVVIALFFKELRDRARGSAFLNQSVNFVLTIRWVLMLTVVTVTSIEFSGFLV